MVCTVRLYEKPTLSDPVLLEGLPGIGFVANIVALHLIEELNAKLFGEIRSSAFQDFAVTTEEGRARFPINELYYHKGRNGERDIIILYGNTQALTTVGQYELCGRILDVAEDLECRYIITVGGLRKRETAGVPKLYCTATDHETLREALDLGAEIIWGQIFGVAGLLIGLGGLRNIKGFCLLAETPGFYPDAEAARAVLPAVCKKLNLKVDLSKIDVAARETRNIVESFGMLAQPAEEKTKRESETRWLI